MRLIDADKVNPSEVFCGMSDFAQDCRNAVIELLSAQPTVDAVPVVRCKDCKHYVSIYGHRFCDVFCDAEEEPYETNPNDFCSYGERLEQEG